MSEETFAFGRSLPKKVPPEAFALGAHLKIDAIVAVIRSAEDTLEPPRLVHRSFDPPLAVCPRVRGEPTTANAERAESTSRERFDLSTAILLSAREAGPFTR